MIKAMQQTQNLKLNLIETSDPLSPAPLNENMDKLEVALNAVRAEAAAGDAALDGRITVLEAKHMVVGAYNGNSTRHRQFLFDYTPVLVWVMAETGAENWVCTAERTIWENMGADVALGLIENGFEVGLAPNKREKKFIYVAMFS